MGQVQHMDIRDEMIESVSGESGDSQSRSGEQSLSDLETSDENISNFTIHQIRHLNNFRGHLQKCSYNSSGIKCLKKVYKNTTRCVYHPIEISNSINPSQKIYNTECPICLCIIDPRQSLRDYVEISKELKQENIVLECGHSFHLECIIGITKLECPVCKTIIESNTLPVRISSSIIQNSSRARRDTERNNFNLIFNTAMNSSSDTISTPEIRVVRDNSNQILESIRNMILTELQNNVPGRHSDSDSEVVLSTADIHSTDDQPRMNVENLIQMAMPIASQILSNMMLPRRENGTS